MNGKLYIPAAICFVAGLTSYTVLTAMGKDVPAWLPGGLVLLFQAIQSFLQPALQKKDESKIEG